jgi:hypothetical protein
VDVGRAYSGVDQYQDSARHRVLCPGDSNRSCVPSHGEGYDEAGVCRVEYDLPSGPISETPFPYEIPILSRCSSTGGAHGRFCNGTLGLHEGAEEILAPSNHHGARTPWNPDCLDPRIGSGAIHLYPVLDCVHLDRTHRYISLRINNMASR